MKNFLIKINQFFITVEKDPIYIRLMKNPLTYVAGAVILAILQIARFNALSGPWGVTGIFANWGASFLGMFGITTSVAPIGAINGSNAPSWVPAFFQNVMSMQNLGIIFGALIATLFASQFKIKMVKNKKQVIAAVLGGFLMGFGARLAGGCNIGALFGQITQLNLNGWVFGLFLLGGTWIGSKLLLKFFL